VIRLDGTNAEQGREILKSHESDHSWSKPDDGGSRRTAVQMAREPDVSILVNADTKVIVQGPRRQGRFYGLRNREYGRRLSVREPKKAGTDVDGIPVFASVKEAVAETARPRPMVIVPAPAAGAAVLEAAEAGVELIAGVTEGIPMHDERASTTASRPTSLLRACSANCSRTVDSGRVTSVHPRGSRQGRRPGGQS